MADFSTLMSIFRMMSPADLSGLPRNSFGTLVDQNLGTASKVLQFLFDYEGNGSLSVEQLRSKIEGEFLKNTTEDQRKAFYSNIRIFTTGQNPIIGPYEWPKMFSDNKQPSNEKNVISQFDEIVSNAQFAGQGKNAMIVLSNSSFVHPAVRQAEKAQLFLNFIPSIVMSRCTPYLSVEAVLDRPQSSQLSAPSMLKFLMGAQDMSSLDQKSANVIMHNANIVSHKPGEDSGEKTDRQQTMFGMEMFTSPQTLVDPTPLPLGSRYAPVIDPFRPFMSIESLTVTVTPTVGIYSFKKANLVLKLHDRSRLSEIADFIQPIVYTQTTIWLTYGWRHTVEPGNPYADFINSTMLVREPYGISNSSYDFDASGQVTLNLELFTKSVQELRDISLTKIQGSAAAFEADLRNVVDTIRRLKTKLRIDKPEGMNVDVRPYTLLDAAEEGSYPDDLTSKDALMLVDKLKKSVLKSSEQIDVNAAKELGALIEKYYSTNSKDKKFHYEAQRAAVTDRVIEDVLADIMQNGHDPFALSATKETKKSQELGQFAVANPMVEIYDNYNKIPTIKNIAKSPTLVSFGKIFSSIMMKALNTIDGIDEVHIFFYTFNDFCGKASNQNIAEFPINVAIFKDQLKNHILSKRTTNIRVEDFIDLLIQSQLQDPRGPGFGLYAHYEAYDPKQKDPRLTKNAEQKYESIIADLNKNRGPFKMPVIEVHIESTYRAANASVTPTDLLRRFEGEASVTSNKQSGKYVRIVRIHVVDKQVDPYPAVTSMLRTPDGSGSIIVDPRLEAVKLKQANITKFLQSLGNAFDAYVSTNERGAVFPNEQGYARIKELVSALIPSIIYGSGASTISSISISTKQDQLLSAAQMLANKAGRPSVTQPNGAGTGGLPLRIIPASISVTCLGCPMINYMQMFFLDVNTGTTIDNVYGVTGLTHTINPGGYTTNMQLTWYDAYGHYEAAPTWLEQAAQTLKNTDELKK